MEKKGIESLIISLEKMKSDLNQSKIYLTRLKSDRAKMKATLEQQKANLAYLKEHCGVVAIDYVKTITAHIKRLLAFLKSMDEDLAILERAMTKHMDNMSKTEREIEKLKKESECKVITFKGKNNGKRRREEKN